MAVCYARLTHAGDWYNAHTHLGPVHESAIMCLLLYGLQGVSQRLILQREEDNTCQRNITNSVTICEAPHLCNSFLSFSSVSVFPSYRLDCLYVVRSTSWLYPYYACTTQGSRSSNHATLSKVDLDCVPMVIAEGHVPSAAD